MTTMIHNPQRDCVSSLGIPVDNLDLQETVERVVAMAKTRDGRARLVSTLNVDFLVNSLGTRFYSARHPELLDVLRNSDLVTADGFPIVWLSRIVGRPLRQRVCGSDLVPALAPLAAREGLSIFLLGGSGDVAQRAAGCLQEQNPELIIAGTAAPFIHTQGPGLANCVADDEALLERINGSGADILLVGLGNPKQELWFNRNRERLKVPVSIGVGGTFEFITGSVQRAPVWVQRLNLEWLFRISQDPARLWRRYSHGLFKLAALSAPLLQARLGEMLAFSVGRVAAADTIQWRTVWSNRDQAMAVLRMPRLVSRDYLHALVQGLAGCDDGSTLHILDFSAVHKVEMAGHEALLSLSELQQRGDVNLQFMGVADRLRRDLAVTRVLDAVQGEEGNTLDALGAGAPQQDFSCRSYTLDDAALIFLGGRINDDKLRQLGFVESLRDIIRHRNCYLDLRDVNLLESSAIAALSPFFDGREGQAGRVLFSGITPQVRQMLKVAGLGEPRWSVADSTLLAAICEGAA
jgi:N-acetylglucosaminyldiphosphoundecaprenol N-acetyl-beta-D-mannosaminyltransferase